MVKLALNDAQPSPRTGAADALMARCKQVGLALLPLTVYVTGALAVDRIVAPGGDSSRTPAAQHGRQSQKISLRDERSLLVEVTPDWLPAVDADTVGAQASLSSTLHRVKLVAATVQARTPETSLAIDLETPGGAPAGSYVIVRGLPIGATLSHGIAIGPEVWLVDADEVERLALRVSPAQPVNFTLGLQWVSVEGRLLAQDNLVVEALPPQEFAIGAATTPLVRVGRPAIEMPLVDDEPTQPVIGGQTNGRAKAETKAKPATTFMPEVSIAVAEVDAKAIAAALARGRRMLEIGNFAAGRPLLERAANGGSAAAAMLIANSYDASWLRGSGAIGMTADAGKARHWYEQARRLGAADAAKYLAALGAE